MLSSPLDAVAASARPFVWKDIEETATHTTDLKAQPEQGNTVNTTLPLQRNLIGMSQIREWPWCGKLMMIKVELV